MLTAFAHPQFTWFRFHISAPPIRWMTIPWVPGNPTYVDADDVAIVEAGR